MNIKEVSKKYQIPADTLRYYERTGVLPPVPRTETGLRDYGAEECAWIELAICMRRAGVPVNALAEYVRLCQAGEATFPARLELLRTQKKKLLEQQEKLTQTLQLLERKIKRYEDAVNCK